MIIPKTLRILGFDWEIKKDKNVAYEGSIHGSTHTGSQIIFLEPDDTKQKNEQTLLHEVMHALWWQQGLNARYSGEQKKFEEEIIAALASGLYQVLIDNKLLK